ncbi:MAG TPA: nicotinate (nicotinamide) nucleotide adenylyltransferase [Candidatus Dormibacteraeota bacterium]|nr:nicotinate (nicotinamide) nucleotide adenylyltransferase [Candidatus Dormibacteraeota bacterium]
MEPALVVFGGTFDPPHKGHMAVVSGLRDELDVPVLVVPNGAPPHRGGPVAPAACRLEMLELAVFELGDPQVSVSDMEVRREGPSFTADTLQELVQQNPGTRLLLALGSDAAESLPSWERPEQVLLLATLIVFDRLGADRRAIAVLAALEGAGFRVGGARALELDAPEIEASEIRGRLAAGENCTPYLSAPVLELILSRGLYGAPLARTRSGRGIIAGA